MFKDSDIKRFWQRVDKSGDCWLWTARRDKDGYGGISIGSKNFRAHRIAYELTFGAIPKGLIVCHHCDNPPCCNPSHLFLGTQQDNSTDRVKKGRAASGDRNGSRLHPERRPRGAQHRWQTKPESRLHGERNGRAKLSEKDVQKIRNRLSNGEKRSVLAKEFNVSWTAINYIAQGRNWSKPHG